MTGTPQPVRTRFGAFRLDEAEALLERDGHAVEIAPRAFQLLCELARRPGQLVTKDALLDAVWGHRHINESALKNIVSQLRQALGDDARESRIIETAPRRGYRFIAPLTGSPPRSLAGAAPLPAVAVPLREPGVLVGREGPLARMHAAWSEAQRGHRQVVFVLGDAGVGKSALIERFVAESGARVAFGQCIEHYGSGEPYMPVLEALNALCRDDGGDAVIRAMREAAPTWLLQLPWFVSDEDRRNLQREAAGATQDRMLREFGEITARIPPGEPVLLVLEDLHWSDHATVQLLGYLARRRGPSPLMLVGTFRPTELVLEEHPLAGLRQELRTKRLSDEIDLESLSEEEVAAYLERRFGHAAPERLVRSLHAHTAGLPLFLVNVVDELAHAGTLGHDAHGWRFPEPHELTVPRNVLGLLEAQIARLPADQQRMLGAASVAGVEFLHVPLADVLGLPADALQEMLEDAARRAGWLHATGARALAGERIASRYQFGHSMYRQVLYERLAPAQRLQWHRQWAAALEQAYGEASPEIASELALHFERGEVPGAAAAQLSVVASRALELGAAKEALAAARRGLQLGGRNLERTPELELRVLEGVALSRLHVMADARIAETFAHALSLEAESGTAGPRALQGAWWGHYSRGELEQARSLADRMRLFAKKGDAGLRLAAHIAVGFIHLVSGETTLARVELQAAFELHEREGVNLAPTQFVQDPGVEVATGLALACWLAGEPRRARELARDAAVRATVSHHALSELTALFAASILHALAGEFDTVFELTERVYGLIHEHGLPAGRSDFAWLHGRALVARGRIDEGLQEMREAARSAEDLGMRIGLPGFHHHHVQACLDAGQRERARASVEEGIALANHVGSRMLLPGLLRQRAELLAADGELDAATADLHSAAGLARLNGSAFFEMLALADAQRLRSTAADPVRLGELLALYEGDPSPRVEAARVAGQPQPSPTNSGS